VSEPLEGFRNEEGARSPALESKSLVEALRPLVRVMNLEGEFGASPTTRAALQLREKRRSDTSSPGLGEEPKSRGD
jgi:hypothetical protein